MMKRILEDIRAHAAPITTAVVASTIISRLGLVATIACVIAAGTWLAWRKGWRITLTTHRNHQQEEHNHAEHDTDSQ